MLGLFLSRHPMELVSGDWIGTDRLADRVGQRVIVAGVLDADADSGKPPTAN